MQTHAWSAGLASVCVLIAACGGGGGENATPPTELPASVTISGPSTSEVLDSAQFTSDATHTGTGISYLWDFGDGNSSADARPTHRYSKPGHYEVTLTLGNEAGASRSTTTRVVVGQFSNVKGSVCSEPGEFGWCWQRPRPTGNTMHDTHFLDSSVGWAVGESGLILKTTDGGAHWSGQHSGVSTRLVQVRFANASVGWALGDTGAILKTNDGGATWAAQASGIVGGYGFYGQVLSVFSSSTAIIVNPYGGTRVTVDGGENWTTSVINPTLVTPSGTLWSLGYYDVIKSVDFGKTSTPGFERPPYPFALEQMSFADDLHGWIAGKDLSVSYPGTTRLWRTTDGGASWQALAPGGLIATASISYLKFRSATHGWLVAENKVYRSTDAGSTWTPIALPSDLPSYYWLYSADAIDADTFSLTIQGAAYLTSDGGASWSLLKIPEESPYETPRLQVVERDTLWLHYFQRSYRSSDRGATWQRIFGADMQDTNDGLRSVWFFDAKKGMALSSSGSILDTENGGVSWERRTLTTTPTYGLGRLQFASATTGWLLSEQQGIYKSTDGGKSWWSPLTSLNLQVLSDFHFLDENQGWTVSRSGDVYRSSDGGQIWDKQASLAYWMNGLRFATPSVGVVVGSGGIIARTSDGGAHWSLRPSGVTQDLRRVVFVGASTGWAIGDYGTVIKTTDGGLTWTRVPVSATASLYDVAFADAQHGWIVGDNGTVLATSDGGLTWAPQRSGTLNALYSAHFVDARTGWIAGNHRSIIATATGGQ
jgi:photosystem II stability/assembly factor-like uncharacterized protein